MKESTDPIRNRPAEKGTNNDPNIREESAYTGTQNNSDSQNGYEQANQHVTMSSMDDANLTDFDTDDNADATFDEIDKEDD